MDNFDTPILLIAFNRPELFNDLIDLVRKIAPSKVYVAVDGPRKNNIYDEFNVNQTISLIEKIDWHCELKVLKRETNLGCGLSVSSAISWVFETESSVIILEDDIRPNVTFFSFCAQALQYYKDDPRIMTINGHSTIEITDSTDTFRMSKYPEIWGWATWKRSWEVYNLSLENLPKISFLNLAKYYGWNFVLASQSRINFRQIRNMTIDTWDYQLVYISILYGKLHLIANYNLSENVGFNSQATHTIYSPEPSPRPREINSLIFNDELKVNEIYERRSRKWLQDQLYRSARTYIRIQFTSMFKNVFRFIGISRD